MSVLKLPMWVINEIDKTRKKFLWKNIAQERGGIHLVNWELVCMPKDFGGLGIIDLKMFNEALLAKWYWYWHKPEQRIWKVLVQATVAGERPSDLPRSKFFTMTLKNTREFCDTKMRKIIGNGENTLFWHHNWGHGILKYVFQLLYQKMDDPTISVSQALQPHFLQEIATKVDTDDEIAQFEKLQLIISTQDIVLTREDEVIWPLTSDGNFSVKSAYKELKNEPRVKVRVHKIWKLTVPPRMKVFAWLVFYDRILTMENLTRRGWNMPSRCVLCKRASENIFHLFSECQFSLEVYQNLSNILSLPQRNWKEVLKETQAQHWIVHKRGDIKSKEMLLIAMFVCWRERCSRTFKEETKGTLQIIEEVREQWNLIH